MRRQLKFSIWFPIVPVAAFATGYLFWQQTLIPKILSTFKFIRGTTETQN